MIVFLDIDDVLLTKRARALTANIARLERGGPPDVFDPVAVAWLVRLCRLSSAKVVVSSSWRNHMSTPEILDHLISQGIAADLFHAVPCCPRRELSTKAEDIQAWLAANSTDIWVALDDDRALARALGNTPGRGLVVQINAAAGFGPVGYWRAMRHFGASDPVLCETNP